MAPAEVASSREEVSLNSGTAMSAFNSMGCDRPSSCRAVGSHGTGGSKGVGYGGQQKGAVGSAQGILVMWWVRQQHGSAHQHSMLCRL
jgi:hypothetical protein